MCHIITSTIMSRFLMYFAKSPFRSQPSCSSQSIWSVCGKWKATFHSEKCDDSATTSGKATTTRGRAEQKGFCELAVKTLGNQNVSDDFIPAAAATQLGGNWGAQWKHPRFSSRVDPGVDLIVEHLQQG